MAYKLLGFKPSHPCASGTTHSDGGAISAAVRQQHETALRSYPAHQRQSRSDKEVARLYREAMEEKSKRSGAAQNSGPLFD